MSPFIALVLICSALIDRVRGDGDGNHFHHNASILLDRPTIATVDSNNSSFLPFQDKRNLQTVCTEIPSGNLQTTWDWARGKSGFGFNTLAPATGMMVYQNDVKIFEQYAPENVCPLLCFIPFIRNAFNKIWRFGGSPTQKFTMFSGTKTFAGLCALLLVKQGYLDSLDDKVSRFVDEWRNDANKVDITVRELLTLSSGIHSDYIPAVNLWGSINAPFTGKKFAYGFQPFVVFAHIVVLTTGRSAQQYLQDELYGPLNVSVQIDSIGFPSEITNFYSGGFVTLPDLYTVANEILQASMGKGTIFNEDDVKQMATSGLESTYALAWWRSPRGLGGLVCQPGEVLLHMIGAGGQIVTIFPRKRLVVVKSGFFLFTAFKLFDGFWERLFSGLPCDC